MKMLLFLTLYLISGPGSCFDVIGYSGGSVVILSGLRWSKTLSKYIMKTDQNKCINQIPPDPRPACAHDERFRLYRSSAGFVQVFIRGLTPQDAGWYRIGLGSDFRDVELKVESDACCGVRRSLSGSQGEMINFSCRYLGKFENDYKYLFKLGDQSVIWILNTGSQSQNGRFSISEDRSSKVLNVRISDVREDDGRVYYCGVFIGEGALGYFLFFSEVELQVTAKTTPDEEPPSKNSVITQSSLFQ